MSKCKLLTPGPLTTTMSVKNEMLSDRCTWDDEYKEITRKIRKQLLEIANVTKEEYTAILMQGSGTFGVEAVFTTAIGKHDTCLIITNGAYGDRMVEIVERAGISHIIYGVQYNQIPYSTDIECILRNNTGITHIAMVHCETTTGILNPLEPIAALAQKYGKIFIVDAMSSFGGIDIDVKGLSIDFLISSANKCIQGVPGFCFVIAKLYRLLKCKKRSASLSLDLYDQWESMDTSGKWRYTSPTHAVAAFSKALDELVAEGGVQARNSRYENNNKLLRDALKTLGIHSYIDEKWQSPIISTFLFPYEEFDFTDFYHYIKERGYILYPGKLTDVDTFRIGNIGEIDENDIHILSKIMSCYMKRGVA